ncbi:DUF3943 domain-containing protein [Sediminibacterium sp. WSJ-3]|nr:DUF3943 domain-containing protein [Sediminibacterium soli]
MLLLLAADSIHAQVPDHNQPFSPDSIKIRNRRVMTPQKRFGRSMIELGLSESLVWGYDRYLKKADWAYINFQTMASHLSPKSWEWDNDPFPTNQIGHPFHGSIFYNSFRSNGYNFWQSMPAAFAGSYLWETFSETQPPAPNDFINTSFGGIILGEVTHRLAEKIHNSRRRGFAKKAGEVFATLINPMDGLNRVLDGKWGSSPTAEQKQELPPLTMAMELGLRKFNVNDNKILEKGKFGVFGRLTLNYGSPGVDYKTPFSNFSIVTEFGQDDSSLLNVVSVQASVTGWKLNMLNNAHFAMVTANYDYIRNEAFFYSAEAVKMNLLTEYNLGRRKKLNTYFGLGPILLSAIPNPHKDYYGRNYDYGTGLAFHVGGILNFNNRFYYNLRYRGGWSYTINGGRSDYYLSAFTNELGWQFGKYWGISAESGFFKLRGFYTDHGDMIRSYPYLRLTLKCTAPI